MNSKRTNVASIHAHRHRASYKLLDYLRARLDAGDLHGLLVHSLDASGTDRTHMTGVFDSDKVKALGAILSLSIRLTASQGGFQDGNL